MNQIPNNYRQLKNGETIRKGDVYQNVLNPRRVGRVNNSIGRLVDGYRGDYTFWRRRHTKAPVVAKPAKKADVTPVTIVEFYYNDILRQLQVIKMDDRYLKGLEITRNRDGQRRYQFKSFLLGRIDDPLRLVHFGPIDDFKG